VPTWPSVFGGEVWLCHLYRRLIGRWRGDHRGLRWSCEWVWVVVGVIVIVDVNVYMSVCSVFTVECNMNVHIQAYTEGIYQRRCLTYSEELRLIQMPISIKVSSSMKSVVSAWSEKKEPKRPNVLLVPSKDCRGVGRSGRFMSKKLSHRLSITLATSCGALLIRLNARGSSGNL
jgi:hypothetical protein